MELVAHPTLLCLRGELLVVGKEPDGDSIRFVPDVGADLDRLRRAQRIRRSTVDGSVQLRLEAIDTPETHYGKLAQPLGDEARDRLLALVGFSGIRLSGQEVTAATPERIPAAILAQMADANGRPVALLLAGAGAGELPPGGGYVPLTPELLRRTANGQLLASGDAYLTVYSSLDPEPAAVLREVARTAREASLGVWARDATAAFRLTGQADIGPDGALILPKLFRRCSDYLRERTPGQTLPEWLRAAGTPDRPEDDAVTVAGRATRLSELVTQDGDTVHVAADLLDLVFQEK